MKTRNELRQQARAATRGANLIHMRENAMEYRMALAPDTYLSLEQRGQNGVFALRLAISYRDMARDMGKWAR